MGVVAEFVAWWIGQLGDIVPRRLREADVPAGAVLAEPWHGPDGTPAGVALLRRRRGRDVPLGRFALDVPGMEDARRAVPARHSLFLRLPPAALLERSLTLPLVTEPDLDRVLAYELDRISPFAADEVWWSYAVERRDRAAGRLHVRLALVPRAGLLPVLSAMRLGNLVPAALLAASRQGHPTGHPTGLGGSHAWRIGLDAAAERRGIAAHRRLSVALAAACVLLALLAAALPFWRQEAALAAAEARIAALRPQIAEVEALRRRIADRAAGTDVLTTEATRLGRPLETVAALTAILPDDTHLTALTLRGRTLAFTGRSAAAARLIPALSADPIIRNPAFAAPVTRTEAAAGERRPSPVRWHRGAPRADLFSIRAELAP